MYEQSPLDRTVGGYGPGAAWVEHGAQTDYLSNTASGVQACKLYAATSTALTGGSSNYAAGTLQVVKTTDEDGHISYTFTDRLGRTLLTRQMNGDTQHDTYYVYDSAGNLRYVLQPEYQTTADLSKYAFQYRYDTYNRCVRKTLPGAAYVAYEYNTKDQLVFSQDGNQRGRNKWTYYEYDNHGRLTEQGECTKSGTAATGKTVWIKNYYDEYDFLSEPGFAGGNYVVLEDHGEGHLTGRRLCTTDGDTIAELICYDVKGRESWVMRNNLLDGYDLYLTNYTYSGQPDAVGNLHFVSWQDTNALIVVIGYTYDSSDRLIKVTHAINGNTQTLAEYTYDNLDRLLTRTLHGNVSNKLTYSYNIRDWLTKISSSKFTQDLYYNTGNGTARYNGNISSMTWKAGNESTTRGYKFAYDGLNRLTSATYGEGTNLGSNTNRFTEKVTNYDKNGNIKALQRYGQTSVSAYGLIDNLTFTIDGNRLTRVDDAVTASAFNNGFEFKDGVKQANEYAYDANGNLTKDLNKGISNIEYNFLNLPGKVTFTDGSTIEYVYAADGTKLRTVHTIGGTTTTTDYCGDVIYENGVRKYLLTEEGYVTLADNKYHYYLQDHQGNNRVVIASNGTVEETNHYYPFGGLFASTSPVQPYKYN